MRILLCNKYYYRRGGDCSYTLGLESLLKSEGHEVAVFAMDHPETEHTEWRKYFPPEVNLDSFKSKLGMFVRSMGYGSTRSRFLALMDDFKPQIVHLGNIHSQLSPVIAELASKKGAGVVWTMHDYKLLCPRYDCLRPGAGNCELCFTDKKNVLKYSCMKNSRAASMIAYLEAIKWSVSRLELCTDAFICPSHFMLSKMQQGGFEAEKLHHICNFIDSSSCQREDYSEREDYYCYVGRLSGEKGIATLTQVAAELPYKLKVLGDGPLRQSLPHSENIEYLGRKDWGEVKDIVGKARFIVIPSEWYENNPLSVIEALSLGTPVLGARIGGIPELIDDWSGACFESGSMVSLKTQLKYMFGRPFDYERIADASQQRFSAQKYYSQLMEVYSRLK